MKSTGVIRKIDELGRIVLPKEIRRKLGIRDGENLEILVEDENIILKKYSKLNDNKNTITNLCEIICDIYQLNIIVSDRDKIIFTNLNDELIDKELDNELLKLIHNREQVNKSSLLTYNFNGKKLEGYFLVMPIISSIDCLGLVICYDNKPINNDNFNLLKLIANVISNKIDIS